VQGEAPRLPDTVVASYQGRDLSGQYRFCSMYPRAGGGWQFSVTHTHRLAGDEG
jgi:hypothetical protein